MTQAQLVQSYRHLFLVVPEGRAVLLDMMKAGGLFRVTGVIPDSELQHLEGARDMVRRILGILSLDEQQIMKLAMGVEYE